MNYYDGEFYLQVPHAREAFQELVEKHARSKRGLSRCKMLKPLIASLFESADIMPGDLCEALDLERGANYAQGVKSLRQAVAT